MREIAHKSSFFSDIFAIVWAFLILVMLFSFVYLVYDEIDYQLWLFKNANDAAEFFGAG